MRISSWRRNWPQPWLLFLLLGGSIVLAAVLALSAQRALQGQREATERALSGEATFAAFSLASHTGRDVYWGMVDLFAPVTGFEFANRGDARAPLDTLARDPCEYEFTCVVRDSAQLWFRLDSRDGTLATLRSPRTDSLPTTARNVLQARLSDILVADRAPARSRRPFTHLLLDLDGRPRIIVAVPVGMPPSTAAMYGFAIDPAIYGRAILYRTLSQRLLLPAFLIAGVPSESLYTYRLTDRTDRLLVQSGIDAHSAYAVELPVDSTGGDLRVRLALGTAFVERRRADSLPPMRLATVLGLFGLNAVLIVFVIARLRREYAVARRRADFTAGVSHELRTPLTQILLFGESLSAGTLRVERDRRHAGEVIVREASRLIALVDNVLRYVRSERGPPPVRAGWLDISVAAAVREVVISMQPFARERHVNVIEILDASVMVHVDPQLLRHALVNLLDNALKYGPAGQGVGIGCERAGKVVRIWVENQGPGLTAREQQQVWEPFVRLERGSDAATATGTGLGLTVVRYLATLSDGRAWAEEARGGGIRFVLELPALDPSRSGVGSMGDAVVFSDQHYAAPAVRRRPT